MSNIPYPILKNLLIGNIEEVRILLEYYCTSNKIEISLPIRLWYNIMESNAVQLCRDARVSFGDKENTLNLTLDGREFKITGDHFFFPAIVRNTHKKNNQQ